MSPRSYRLGRRRGEFERTRAAILTAAREVVAAGGLASGVGKVAERAGVSRITIYHHFGSKAGLLAELAAQATAGGAVAPGEIASDPGGALKQRIEQACAAWAADPDLYRQLAESRRERSDDSDQDRALAEGLAARDLLRPGCSIREAEDVIGILTSFPVFDRLHKGGRRSASAVAEILLRMASASVVQPKSV